MRLSLRAILVFLAFVLSAHSWSLYADGDKIAVDSDMQMLCQKLPHVLKEGDNISFFSSYSERPSCALYLYSTTQAKNHCKGHFKKFKVDKRYTVGSGKKVAAYSYKCGKSKSRYSWMPYID
jgi:(p)ppGpp synthase/HD superfamily hydrolase